MEKTKKRLLDLWYNDRSMIWSIEFLLDIIDQEKARMREIINSYSEIVNKKEDEKNRRSNLENKVTK